MKLSKIYSNNNQFKPIIFRDGLNVIYGDIEPEDNNEDKNNEHDLGKTSLLNLIDFMLLKSVDRYHALIKNEFFIEWVFFLEVQLNDGSFLTIRRGVKNNTRISFKIHHDKHQNFVKEDTWDFYDIALRAKKQKNAKEVLSELLNLSIPNGYSYRHFLPYLMRNQYEYDNIFRPFKNRGSDTTWKPFLLSMFGFDGEALKQKYEIESQAALENKILNNEKMFYSPEKIQAIKLALEDKESQREVARQAMDEFDFYNQEQKLNTEIVEDIERKIANNNDVKYSLSYRINKIKESLGGNINEVDFSKIKNLFSEIEVFFPNDLEQSFEEVIAFSKQITSERDTYLKQELNELTQELKLINEKLQALNDNRINALSALKDGDTFAKFKKYQHEYIKIDEDIAKLRASLEKSDIVNRYNESVGILNEESKKIGISIKIDIENGSHEYAEIRKLFRNLYELILQSRVLLLVAPNSKNNPVFDALVTSEEDLTGADSGYTATKIQCVCFAMAFLLFNINENFYRFLFHDGLLEGWGDRPKTNFLNIARKHGEEYGLQYIVTLIKSDVPSNFIFEQEEIVRRLDNTDRLYGQKF